MVKKLVFFKKVKNKIKQLLRIYPFNRNGITKTEAIKRYKEGGKIPWSKGYNEFKTEYIKEQINSDSTLLRFDQMQMPACFGIGLDERVVEYPWILSKLSKEPKMMLDAGSTFNYQYLLDHPVISKKYLFIHTYNPENPNFNNKKISYIYGDLRELPYKDNLFDEIVSQSTIEHIDMDNTMYGYNIAHTINKKSYDYLKALGEMVRVLKPKGQLLVTFPFGKYEHHGFFQQFDEEMLQRIIDSFESKGTIEINFFKYEKSGWRFSSMPELAEVVSYNPHTGVGKLDDSAAHCRGIACIKFLKST